MFAVCLADALHLDYITAAANLRAHMYRIKGTGDAKEIVKLLGEVRGVVFCSFGRLCAVVPCDTPC